MPNYTKFKLLTATLFLFVLYSSCTGKSQKQNSIPSDCECADIASRILMNQQSVDDLDKMKICITQDENKNFKVFHGNAVGDMAEAFAGFSDLCDNISENNSSTQSNLQLPDTLKQSSEADFNTLANEYLGMYHGIQPSYFMKNQYGDDMIINGQKVSVASSDFKFQLKESNTVSLQQTNLEDNSRYYYDGSYKIIDETADNIVVQCSLTDGNSSNPTYNLSIRKNSKSGSCTGNNEPEFKIEKFNTSSNSAIVNKADTNEEVSSEIPESNTDNQNYQSGNYITNGSENHKVYFYNAPDYATRRNAYINTQEEVAVQKIMKGFGYIEFTNDRGEKSIGWISMKDLILKP